MKTKRKYSTFSKAVCDMAPSYYDEPHRQAVGKKAAELASVKCRRRTQSGRAIWDVDIGVIRRALKAAESYSDLYKSCECAACRSIVEEEIELRPPR